MGQKLKVSKNAKLSTKKGGSLFDMLLMEQGSRGSGSSSCLAALVDQQGQGEDNKVDQAKEPNKEDMKCKREDKKREVKVAL